MTQSAIAKYDLRTQMVDALQLSGGFVPNGASAVTTLFGTGFTVSRTGTGAFRVTITRPWAQLVSGAARVLYPDALYRDVRVSAVVPPSGSANGYIDLVHVTSSDVATVTPAAADITASGTARRIMFDFVLALVDVPGNGV